MLSQPKSTPEDRRVALALAASLPDLEARLQRQNLMRLAPIVSRFFPPRYKETSPLPDSDQLLTALMKAVRHLEAEREELVQKIEQAATAGLDSPDSVGRRQALRVWLAERGRRFFSGWATNRRARRFLDLDALKARYQRDRLRCDLLIELCLKLLTGVTEQTFCLSPGLEEMSSQESLRDWLEPGHPEEDLEDSARSKPHPSVQTPVAKAFDRLSRHWLKELGLEGFLSTRSMMGRASTRVLALALLARLAEQLPASQRVETLGAQTLRTLFRCLDPREDKQVQLAAAGLLAVTSRDELRELMTQRLLRPAAVKDDFVVRRGLLRLLASRFNDAAGLRILELLVSERDSSEAVRMSMVEALSAFPGAAASRLLFSLESGRSMADPSPKVRASLALAWEVWLHELGSSEQLPRLSPMARDAEQALLRLFASDPAELVRKTALDVLMSTLQRALTLAHERTEQLGELSEAQLDSYLFETHRLSDALLQSLHRKGLDSNLTPVERTRCAEAQEQLLILLDPARRRLYLTLQAQVANLELGQSCRIAHHLVPDEQTLGRVLAQLSREDFGLYAQPLGGKRGYRVTRGEHFVRRLWRILHEMRHRAPNKRQGFVHTTGRHFAGELRAHPAVLAEVTATTVPGERLLSEQEGSWGRYLPLVDDLLCTSVWHSRPVKLFSAEGMTEIFPPQSFLSRLHSRVKISSKYEQLSVLRRQALSSSEPEEQQQYVQQLSETYGFYICFTPHDHVPETGDDAPDSIASADSHMDEPTHAWPEVRDGAEGGTVRPLSRHVRRRRDAHAPASLHPTLKRVFATAASVTPPEPERLLEAWRAILSDLMVRLTGSIGHLALLVLMLLGYSVVRGVVKMRQVKQARAQIPLVIGGWGTRGKSGTERLKAALFQGMGYEVLVKTTGCEAMVIHAMPDSPAMELFLYRPYDKATIWEQFECIRLAARLDVQVFLYECMALQPRYVSVIQNDWSRDDLSTLTNAYPDHEDIQGPSGVDVAWCISAFIRNGGRVFTTEEQMLPVLKEAARRKGAQLTSVPMRTSELMPQDFLERFPYQEHPRNIALVLTLARHLGFDPDRALLEMADKVVPDIGVLKAYPKVNAWGRELQFISGNSANERTGFMSNWRRMGFDEHVSTSQPGEWIVTVVNNRMDRVARSQVFAEILVRDISAHRHVLIGTNIAGLSQYIQASLEKYVEELTVLQPEDEPALQAGGLTEGAILRRRGRFERYVQQLKLPGMSVWAVVQELETWLQGLGVSGEVRRGLHAGHLTDQLERWMAQRQQEASGPTSFSDELAFFSQPNRLTYLEATLEGLVTAETLSVETSELPVRLSPEILRQELARCVVRSLARLRRMCYAHAIFEQGLQGSVRVEAVNQALRDVYRELFLESLIPLHDSNLSGDAIIRACAQVCPPGTRIKLMGTQNIKGTGLDFVYRWASIGTVERYLAELRETRRGRLIQSLVSLREHPDYGLIDACQALSTVEYLRHHGTGNFMTLSEELKATSSHLKGVVDAKRRKLQGYGDPLASASLSGAPNGTPAAIPGTIPFAVLMADATVSAQAEARRVGSDVTGAEGRGSAYASSANGSATVAAEGAGRVRARRTGPGMSHHPARRVPYRASQSGGAQPPIVISLFARPDAIAPGEQENEAECLTDEELEGSLSGDTPVPTIASPSGTSSGLLRQDHGNAEGVSPGAGGVSPGAEGATLEAEARSSEADEALRAHVGEDFDAAGVSSDAGGDVDGDADRDVDGDADAEAPQVVVWLQQGYRWSRAGLARLGLAGLGLSSLEQMLEPIESVRRRDQARLISEALIEGLVSHERAAAELRRLNKEQKGGWLSSALQQRFSNESTSSERISEGS